MNHLSKESLNLLMRLQSCSNLKAVFSCKPNNRAYVLKQFQLQISYLVVFQNFNF